MADQSLVLEPIIRGDGYDGAIFNLIDDSTPANPIDLTGVTIRMQVRQNLIDRTLDPLLEILSTGENPGITLPNAAGGQIQIEEINAINIPAGGYFFDMEITFPTGRILTPIYGSWQILDEVTFTTETAT